MITGLIALDIDGTVLLEDDTVSPGVVEAVADAEAAGYVVTLATGRSWEATEYVLDLLSIRPEYVVCANGAMLLRLEDGQYERHAVETFDATEVLQFLHGHLPDAHYVVELADGARLYTDADITGWTVSRPADRRVTIDQMHGLQVTRVVVVSPDHTGDEFSDLVAGLGLQQVSYAVGWTAWLDIAPQGVDKYTALEQVREALDVPGHTVSVVGDGRNDLGMFDWAGRIGGAAVAMGQAVDEVKDAATEVTSSVHDGGVAAFLRTRLG